MEMFEIGERDPILLTIHADAIAIPAQRMVCSVFQEVDLAAAHLASNPGPHSEPAFNAKHYRVRSGVSLDSICDRTKISRHFLEAIEERAYHRLPGGVFDINYIRQYSESVGCNPEILLADYQSCSAAPGAERRHQSRPAGGAGWWRNLRELFCL